MTANRTVAYRSHLDNLMYPQQLLRVAILTITFALASAAEGQTISGTGTRTCTAFNLAIEQDSNTAIDSFLSWTQGFISGFNASNRHSVDIAIDHAGLFHWLAAYCTASPGVPIYEAVQEMIGIHSP